MSERPTNPNSATRHDITSQKSSGSRLTWLLALAGVPLLGFCGLGPVFIQTPFHLCLGWVFFLIDIFPEISVNVSQCVFGLAVTVVAFALLTWFGKSITVGQSMQWKAQHSGFVLILLLTTFLIGLGATGVTHQIGWIIQSSEPLVGGTGRTYARRMSDYNNMRQVLLGVHNYASAYDTQINQTLISSNGEMLHGWQTSLLPFVEQQALYAEINLLHTWNAPVNRQPLSQNVYVYQCPAVRPNRDNGGLADSHYAANALLFSDPKVRRFDDITDGLSNTIYSGNSSGNYAPWGHPTNWRDPSQGINNSPVGFGSPFRGGSHVAMSDGAVKFISETIDPELLRALSTPRSGEHVEQEW